MKPRPFGRTSPLKAATLAILAASQAPAADLYWDGSGGDSSWTNPANWSTVVEGGVDPLVVPVSSDIVYFSASSVATSQTVILMAARTVTGMVVREGTTTATTLLGGTTIARPITFGAGGIAVESGAGAVTIGHASTPASKVNITVGASQFWTNNSSNLLSILNQVSLGSYALTITGSGNTSIAGIVSSTTATGSLTKSGTGTLTLSSANTYSGLTTIDDGTLILGVAAALPSGTGKGNIVLNGGASAAGTLDLNGYDATINGLAGTANATSSQIVNNATGTAKTLTVGSADVSASFAGSIKDNTSGTGTIALTKIGTGAQALTNGNTYTGTTTVSAGMLALGHATALPGGIGTSGGTSALTLNGGVIGLGNGGFTRGLGTGASQVQWTASGGFAAYDADYTVNLGGVVTPTTVTWATGSFVPAGSALILGSGGANKTVTFANPINLGGAMRTIQVDNGAALIDATLSGPLSNGSLTLTGAGTLNLSVANSYSGATSVSGGMLLLSDANALPGGIGTSGGTSALTLSGGVIGLGSGDFTRGLGIGAEQVRWTGSGGFAAYGIDSTVNLGGIGGAVVWNTGGFVPTGSALILGSSGANKTVTLANPIDLSDATRVFQVDDGTADVDAIISAIISDTGVGLLGALTKTGAGTLRLAAKNTYVGTTTVSAGTLEYGANDVLLGDVVVDGTGALLSLKGYSNTVGTVTVANGGGITGSGTLSAEGLFEVKSGTISAVLGGQYIPLNKTTAGTVVLSGINTYTGRTYIDDGILSINTINDGGVSGALGASSGSAAFLVFDGGTLQYTGPTTSNNRNFTIIGGSVGFFDVSDKDTNLTLSGTSAVTSGNLTKIGGGTLTLVSANGHTGLTTVTDGTLAYGIPDALSTGGVTVNGEAAILSLGSHTDTVGTVTLKGDGQITGTGTSGVLTSTGTFEMEWGTVSAVLAGTGIPLNKSTNEYVTLTNTNTYTGLTTISEGTLAYGVNDALSTGDVTVNGSTAVLSLGGFTDSVGTVTLSGGGQITGTVATGILTSTGTFEMHDGFIYAVLAGANIPLNKSTEGIVELHKPNTFTGLTTVSGGTLEYGISDALSSGPVTVAGGTLDLITFSDTVGTVTVRGGTITSTTGVLTSTGTFAMESGTASAILAGSGIPLNKTTDETAILTRANTYSGNTTISAGRLELGASASFNDSLIITVGDAGSTTAVLDVISKNGTFAISTSQTLKGIGLVSAGGPEKAVTIYGTHAPGNSPGVQTVDGDLIYSGDSSLFVWDLYSGAIGDRGVNAAGGYDGVDVKGTVTGVGATTFKVILETGAFTDLFWKQNRQWDDIFTSDGSTPVGDWTEAFKNISWFAGGTQATGDALTPPGYFSFTPATGTATGHTLYWTAVPEPTSALAGLLVTAGLLRRRRTQRLS